jgi:hypothetical protein
MKMTRQTIRLVALLVILVLVAYLAVHRNGLTAKESEDEAVGEVVDVGRMADRDGYSIVASVVLVALFGFVIWKVLRATKVEDEAKPPPGNGARSTSRP